MSEKSTKTTIAKEYYDLRIIQSLRRIIRSIDMDSRQMINQYQITAPQLLCLKSLGKYESLTVAGVAKEVHLSASTVIGILDRLEAKKFINRERSKRDRRVVDVSISQKGREYLKKAPESLQDKLEKGLGELNELEQSTISLALDRIIELMGIEEVEASPILEVGSIDKKGK